MDERNTKKNQKNYVNKKSEKLTKSVHITLTKIKGRIETS